MARTTLQIPDHVRDILRQAPVTLVGGVWHLQLTMQLSRPDYEATNKVLLLAGGKWMRGAKAHVFPVDPRPVLLGAVETGAIVDKKKVQQAYYTPAALADEVIQDAQLTAGQSILEPSCGVGALAEAVERRVGYFPDCVDNDPVAVATLARKGATRIWEADFLAWAASTVNRYDRIVMNPPFSGGQDMAHVTAAIGLLKPSGRLVAIMSPHWTFAETKAAAEFRQRIQFSPDHRARHNFGTGADASESAWVLHDEGAFKESGTNVNTGRLIYTSPVAVAERAMASAASAATSTPAPIALRKVYPKNRPR